jgi:hypothetical protein
LVRKTFDALHGRRSLPRVLLVAVGLLLPACHEEGYLVDCKLMPCAIPVAIVVTVTDPVGTPLLGGSVRVSGQIVAILPCNAGICVVPGYQGIYALEVVTPGFQTARRTVEVHGTNPQCGCPTADTERWDLIPQSQPI